MVEHSLDSNIYRSIWVRVSKYSRHNVPHSYFGNFQFLSANFFDEITFCDYSHRLFFVDNDNRTNVSICHEASSFCRPLTDVNCNNILRHNTSHRFSHMYSSYTKLKSLVSDQRRQRVIMSKTTKIRKRLLG